jgi:catechol 2,3-dioxygenase-like lactoylglutathione lyase family enzyme
VAEALVPIFRVHDGRTAASWYQRLGFEVVGEHFFTPDLPLYLFLRRGDVTLHLSEHTGDAPPESLAYLYVDDLDAVAREFGAEIVDQPWGREVELTDPAGNRLRIGPVRSER